MVQKKRVRLTSNAGDIFGAAKPLNFQESSTNKDVGRGLKELLKNDKVAGVGQHIDPQAGVALGSFFYAKIT